jgi:pantoate--beta-alanine ligase
MIIFKRAEEITQYIDNQKLAKKSIGFVPTMGALHNGHISLLNESKKANDCSIVSIFVNPTQFNNPEDFAKYPNTVLADIEKLENAECDILFLPSVEEMYPYGTTSLYHYNINNLDTVLEGEFRPGHFQGVCNVVHQLLKYIPAHHLYMGAKDYQQCMVVRQLLASENIPTELLVCPTLREESGLAMSSRNMRLSENGKADAAIIYKCLQHIQQHQHDNFADIIAECEQWLLAKGFKLEYIILAHATNLQVLQNYDTAQPMVVLFAAWLEGVRLIDNMVIN